ncbi:MAG: TldD/PmbA family protein, partial [bacterium]|nr:TldD/PmbA family protein [bacterium]
MTGKSTDIAKYEDEFFEISRNIIKRAVNKGADHADVFLQWGMNTEVQVRLTDIEAIKQSSSKGLGLRIIKNNRLGFASTTDLSIDSLNVLLDKAFELSEVSGEDSCVGLPDGQDRRSADLNILDKTCLRTDIDKKIVLAMDMENAALEYDERIKNSEGSTYRDSISGTILENSLGFSEVYYRSIYSMICQPVVQSGDERRVNYWYSSASHFNELEKPEQIGQTAASRAIRMLGAKKIKTTKMPIIFDPIVASGFLGTIMGCVNGELKYKKETCFCDKLGKKIGQDDITIYDNGTMEKGPGSRPFDGEGVVCGNKTIVEKGVLNSFLYDTYSAKKDGTVSTGNGFRSYQSLPKVSGTNFYLENGKESPESIIKGVDKGLYITGLIGFGINIVNGDYSRGAEGIL